MLLILVFIEFEFIVLLLLGVGIDFISFVLLGIRLTFKLNSFLTTFFLGFCFNFLKLLLFCSVLALL